MKTAICISGELRSYKNCFSSLEKNILQHNNCDIFMHLFEDEYTKNVLDLYNPKKVIITDRNDFSFFISKNCLANKPPETKLQSIYNQWDNIKKSFELIDNNYECVVKLRYDIKYKKPIILSDFDMNKLNVPKGGDFLGGLFDMFAFGSYDIMKVYCGLIDKINFLCDQGILCHPETLNKHNTKNLSINRFDYPIYLRRDFDNLGHEEDRIFTI